MARNYFELSTDTAGQRPALITEARFVELREQTQRFDLFLWVDGPEAMCGRRDVRQAGVTGPFARAATRRCPGRRVDDGDLRASSARTLLAIAKAGAWTTPTAAFLAGNPEAAAPTAKNAFVTFAKGRQLLDFERGHEIWEAFELQRKHHGATEPLVRFRPGQVVPERLGLGAVAVKWCVAWSEPTIAPEPATPGHVRIQNDPLAGAVPVWDSQRAPQVEFVYGVEFIIRDALVNRACDEFVLLVQVSDTAAKGPFVIESVGLSAPRDDGSTTRYESESKYPDARIAVPGRRVQRLRVARQPLARDAVLEWACVAIRYERIPKALGNAEIAHEVAVRVRSVAEGAGAGAGAERCFQVRFRVVDPAR